MIGTLVILLRAALLLAMLGAGTVPQGMMRAADGDGMRMVICTDGGLREVFVTADGTVTPSDPHPDDNAEGHGMACLVISQVMPDHHPTRCPAPVLMPQDAGLVRHADLHLPLATAPPGARPRAPPLSI